MKKYDFITLLVSIVAGVIWWFVGEYVFEAIADRLWMPLVIGIYFAGLAFFVIAAIFISTAIRGFSLPERGSYGKSAALLAVILAAAFLFQFLYALDIKENNAKGSSFIFLLDDSSSMTWNDPNDERIDALRRVVGELPPKVPVTVYLFAHECTLAVPPTNAGDFAYAQIPIESNGGTSIANAIQTVVNDLNSGRLNAGAKPRIILLSDGEDYPISQDVLQSVVDAGTSISTIGLGVEDDSYLQRIADSTGGINVRAYDATQLTEGMRAATREIVQRDRTLVSTREPMNLGFLYGILRTVFLLLIGLGFMIIKGLLLRTNVDDSSVLVENVVAVAIGAVGTEVGMNVLNQPEHTVRIVLCIMFCLLITEFDRNPQPIGPDDDDEHYGRGRPGSVNYQDLPDLADDDEDDMLL